MQLEGHPITMWKEKQASGVGMMPDARERHCPKAPSSSHLALYQRRNAGEPKIYFKFSNIALRVEAELNIALFTSIFGSSEYSHTPTVLDSLEAVHSNAITQ